MWHGIAALATGKFVGDIGAAVDDYVSSVPGKPLGILEDYVGHGIGSEMHMAPDVLNYRTSHRGPKIRPGLCLAIEPMLVRGSIDTAVLDGRLDRGDHGRQALLPVGALRGRPREGHLGAFGARRRSGAAGAARRRARPDSLSVYARALPPATRKIPGATRIPVAPGILRVGNAARLAARSREPRTGAHNGAMGAITDVPGIRVGHATRPTTAG